MSLEGSTYVLDLGEPVAHVPDGQRVRRHLDLLKLAMEWLGGWRKNYREYERLNADIFREFASDLKSAEGNKYMYHFLASLTIQREHEIQQSQDPSPPHSRP